MVLSDSLPVHPLKYFLLILLEEPILFSLLDVISCWEDIQVGREKFRIFVVGPIVRGQQSSSSVTGRGAVSVMLESCLRLSSMASLAAAYVALDLIHWYWKWSCSRLMSTSQSMALFIPNKS